MKRLAATGEDFGEKKRKGVDEGEAEQGENEGGGDATEEKDARADVANFLDVNVGEEELRHGEVEPVLEEISDPDLGGDEDEHGGGIGDPADGHGDGDVAAQAHRRDGGEEHLRGDGEEGEESAGGEAHGDGGAAGLPESFIEDGFGDFLPPCAMAQLGMP